MSSAVDVDPRIQRVSVAEDTISADLRSKPARATNQNGLGEAEQLFYIDMNTADVPSPETPIWRFMDLPKLILTLKKRALYFPVAAAMDDDFETATPSLPPEADNEDQNERWRQYKVARVTMFVNSWYESEHESAAMWKLYGNAIAVRTTFGALTNAIGHPDTSLPVDNIPYESRVFGGRVKYFDPELNAPLETHWNNVCRVLRKRKWYEYEREIRLVCERPANCGENDTPKALGFWARCDIGAIAEKIVVAPKSPAYLEAAVKAVAESFGPTSCKVECSALEKGAPAPPAWALSEMMGGGSTVR
ncbi:MAG TPA: hypothetical protein VKV17_15190 [Bryobacteraceae bacterium]|nr:hypothetical protein [Bryobacteraceae bacterium]